MKKIVSGLILASLFLVPAVAFGQGQTVAIETAPTLDVLPTLERIINVVFTVLLLFAALMIIIAAYQFVTAGGDSGKVGEARNKIMWALVGVVLAFLARGLIAFVRAYIVS